MPSPNQLEPVCDAAGPGEAHIIASMLRENGIEAFVFDTAAQTLQWDAPRIINPYLVHVQHADLEQARKLIASNREASVDLDWDEVDVGESDDETIERLNERHDNGHEYKSGRILKWSTGILIALFVFIVASRTLLNAW